MSSVRSSRGGAVSGWLLLLLAAAYFLLPLLALARFSFQRVPVALLGWHNLFDNWTLDGLLDALHDPGFGPALWLSVRLAIGAIILTLGLLLPTALWVHLRAPKARSLVEVLSVLPYVVPPIALVVGVTGAFRDLAPWFIRSDLSLIPFYTLLAMPFTYRALDAGISAIDLRTLVDASRSLGAGWTTTTLRVLVPNLASALISSAFLTATVVLGEFTIASLLLKETLPMFNLQISQREVQGGFALGLLLLLVSTIFLALITLLTRRRGSTAETATVLAGRRRCRRWPRHSSSTASARRSARPSRWSRSTSPSSLVSSCASSARPGAARPPPCASPPDSSSRTPVASRSAGPMSCAYRPTSATSAWSSRATACSPTSTFGPTSPSGCGSGVSRARSAIGVSAKPSSGST